MRYPSEEDIVNRILHFIFMEKEVALDPPTVPLSIRRSKENVCQFNYVTTLQSSIQPTTITINRASYIVSDTETLVFDNHPYALKGSEP